MYFNHTIGVGHFYKIKPNLKLLIIKGTLKFSCYQAKYYYRLDGAFQDRNPRDDYS